MSNYPKPGEGPICAVAMCNCPETHIRVVMSKRLDFDDLDGVLEHKDIGIGRAKALNFDWGF